MARIGHDLTETRATCDAAITALAAAPAGVRIELEATRRARP
jgi:hypothetical protein